jgi:hypothetical protein
MLAGAAYAKGTPAKVTFTCSVNIGALTASGTVRLLSGPGGTQVSNTAVLTCSSGQTSSVSVHPTSEPAPYFDYEIDLIRPDGTLAFRCIGESPRPDVLGCTLSSGSGAILSVT